MNFKNTKERNQHFDNILDLYHKGSYQEADKLIKALKQKDERDFLYYVNYITVSPACFSFILDAIY